MTHTETLLATLEGYKKFLKRVKLVFASKMPSYFGAELAKSFVEAEAAIEMLKSKEAVHVEMLAALKACYEKLECFEASAHRSGTCLCHRVKTAIEKAEGAAR